MSKHRVDNVEATTKSPSEALEQLKDLQSKYPWLKSNMIDQELLGLAVEACQEIEGEGVEPISGYLCLGDDQYPQWPPVDRVRSPAPRDKKAPRKSRAFICMTPFLEDL